MVTEIVLDTETTGLDPASGDRIVEIGMVELEDLNRTGRTFHKYLNPGRLMSEKAQEIHGLTDEFLQDQPAFGEVANDFLDFIGESRLVIHNAEFDLGFINHELELIGRPSISFDRALDTVRYSRQELPRLSSHKLDALCQHFKIDRSMRVKHGALLDAELLAEVYIRLAGRGQGLFDLLSDPSAAGDRNSGGTRVRRQPRPTPLPPLLTAEEAAAHREFVETLGDAALWNRGPAGE